MRDLTRAVAETPVGSTVPMTILRGDKRMVLKVTLDRRETPHPCQHAGYGRFAEGRCSLPDAATPDPRWLRRLVLRRASTASS
ncbi:MAG: hypothetical protein R3C40_09665 [Parvularculaceae bacterium]